MDFKIWSQVSKFDVKLGVVVKNFKITIGRWLFVFYSKNSLLQGVILNQFSTKQPQCPSGVQWKPLRRGAKRGVWWDGRVDRQLFCPLIFFILCEYIEDVYIYLYIYSKIVTNILMGFKISCQVGGRGPKFQNYSR